MAHEGLTRRDLLAGAGGLALTSRALAGPYGPIPDLRGLAGQTPAQDVKPVGWAVLGLGNYALNLIMPAMAACKHSKLVAVISGNDEKAFQNAEKYGLPKTSAYTYDIMDRIKDDPNIEVVYVITPPGTHRDFTIRALRLGKHVCCEKPMANTAEECKQMVEEARKQKKLLQIGYRCHYEAHNMRAIQLARGGLGRLRTITSEHGFNMPGGTWRTRKVLAGGGALWDIGIYSLNAALYLANELPTEVFAYQHNLPEPRFADVDDTTHFQMAFKSGVIASCTSSYSYSGASKFQVIGMRGSLVADPATPYSGNRLFVNGNQVPIERNNQFADQMDDLSLRIRLGGETKVPGEMGWRDLIILEAVQESVRTGKPVKLTNLPNSL